MSDLFRLYQIKGGKQLREDLDALQQSYDGSKVNTTVIDKAAVGEPNSAGYEPETYFNVNDLLALLKAENDRITSGAAGENLASLRAAITVLDNALNGDEGLANKQILDVVRTELERVGGTVTVPDNNHILDKGAALEVYSIDNKPMFDASGKALTFRLDTAEFSGAPSELDVTAAKTAGELRYKTIEGDFKFKVFPVGSWKLQELPASALLDNEEMKSIAYEQAVSKIIVDVSKNQDLIAAIKEQIGEKTITTIINELTDNMLTETARVENDAIKLTQIQGSTDGETSETISRATAIYSKAATDDLIADINNALGRGPGSSGSNSIIDRINYLEEEHIDRNRLVRSVKNSSAGSSDETVLSEKAVTDKFVNVGIRIDEVESASQAEDIALSDRINTKFAKADIVKDEDEQWVTRIGNGDPITSDEKVISEAAVVKKVESIEKSISDLSNHTDGDFVLKNSITDTVSREPLTDQQKKEIPNIGAIRDYVDNYIVGTELNPEDGTIVKRERDMDAKKYDWSKITTSATEVANQNTHVYSTKAADEITNAINARLYPYSNIVVADGNGINSKETLTANTAVLSKKATEDLVADTHSKSVLTSALQALSTERVSQSTKIYTKVATDKLVADTHATSVLLKVIRPGEDETVDQNTYIYTKQAVDEAIANTHKVSYQFRGIIGGSNADGSPEVIHSMVPVYSRLAIDDIVHNLTLASGNAELLAYPFDRIIPATTGERVTQNTNVYSKAAVDELLTNRLNAANADNVLLTELQGNDGEAISQITKVYTAAAVDSKISNAIVNAGSSNVLLTALTGFTGETVSQETAIYTKAAADHAISAAVNGAAEQKYSISSIVGDGTEVVDNDTPVYSKNAIDNKVAADIAATHSTSVLLTALTGYTDENITQGTAVYTAGKVDQLIAAFEDSRYKASSIEGVEGETINNETLVLSKLAVQNITSNLANSKFAIANIEGTETETVDGDTKVYSANVIDAKVNDINNKIYLKTGLVGTDDEAISSDSQIYTKLAVDNLVANAYNSTNIVGHIKDPLDEEDNDEPIDNDTPVYSQAAVDDLVNKKYDASGIVLKPGEILTSNLPVYSKEATDQLVADRLVPKYDWNNIDIAEGETLTNETPVYSKTAVDNIITDVRSTIRSVSGNNYDWTAIVADEGETLSEDTPVYSKAATDRQIHEEITQLHNNISDETNSYYRFDAISKLETEIASNTIAVYSKAAVDYLHEETVRLINQINTDLTILTDAYDWNTISPGKVIIQNEEGEDEETFETITSKTPVYSKLAVEQLLVNNAYDFYGLVVAQGESAATYRTPVYTKNAVDALVESAANTINNSVSNLQNKIYEYKNIQGIENEEINQSTVVPSMSYLTNELTTYTSTINTNIQNITSDLDRKLTDNINNLSTTVDTSVQELNKRLTTYTSATNVSIDKNISDLDRKLTDNINALSDNVDNAVEDINNQFTEYTTTFNNSLSSEIESVKNIHSNDFNTITNRINTLDSSTYLFSSIIGTENEEINRIIQTYSKNKVDQIINKTEDYIDNEISTVNNLITSEISSAEARITSRIQTVNSNSYDWHHIVPEEDEIVTDTTLVYSSKAIDNIIETKTYDYEKIVMHTGTPSRDTAVPSIELLNYRINTINETYIPRTYVEKKNEEDNLHVYSKDKVDELLTTANSTLNNNLTDAITSINSSINNIQSNAYLFTGIIGADDEVVTQSTQVYSKDNINNKVSSIDNLISSTSAQVNSKILSLISLIKNDINIEYKREKCKVEIIEYNAEQYEAIPISGNTSKDEIIVNINGIDYANYPNQNVFDIITQNGYTYLIWLNSDFAISEVIMSDDRYVSVYYNNIKDISLYDDIATE